MEGFIRLVEEAVDNGKLHGVMAPSTPVISHLCYADDTVLYSQATMVEANELLRILGKYAQASGQIINLEKSSMTFSPGTPQSVRTAIQGLMGIPVVEKFEKYLGMPAVVGRSEREVFAYLKDIVWNRIKRWNERDFSMAGREVLIKAVLQAIPTYVMSCFLIPSTLLQEIEKLVRQYWWGGGERSMSWLPWKLLCQTKGNGGMGFKDLTCFNLAMLSKQGWRLITKPSSLFSRLLKARYFPRGSFFTAEVGERPSTTWRSIFSARDCLSSGLRVRVGNGATTSIWGYRWLPSTSSGRVITRRPSHDSFPNTVSDLIDWTTWSWNYDLISQTFWPVDTHNILQVLFGAPETADKLVWAFSKSGQYTVRSCYHNLLTGKIGAELSATSLVGSATPQWTGFGI